ncbi:YdcH family protein [Aquabacterium sp. J223]|uniref:YdcH family protein n=1 Tax=Aquabacterium sp. J223 TaxID=2898431 RepID=UPI0021AE2717|nr:YdcH family protein [Aquabacterium sp. J223]UUX97013.1 YdcH family protein [Aquabacterium sp. J223]
MDDNLHSPARQLIELRMRHAELDSRIDDLCAQPSGDELRMRRLKKERLQLRDAIARLEADLEPRQPA